MPLEGVLDKQKKWGAKLILTSAVLCTLLGMSTTKFQLKNKTSISRMMEITKNKIKKALSKATKLRFHRKRRTKR
jgi:hypothetical protein